MMSRARSVARWHRIFARAAFAALALSLAAVVITYIVLTIVANMSAETLRSWPEAPFVWLTVWGIILAASWIASIVALAGFLRAVGAQTAIVIAAAVVMPLLVVFAYPLAMLAMVVGILWSRSHVNGLGIPAGWLGCTRRHLAELQNGVDPQNAALDPFGPDTE